MYLSHKEFQTILQNSQIVEQNIYQNPLELALKGFDSAICSQIKYLNRCREKLPTYFQKRCIIPPLSYEQCSSELSILSREYQGESCLDLTCGLGVDSYALSKRFDRVTTIERDEVLAEIARHNFGLLDVDNVEVVCGDSQQFVEKYSGEVFDMVFVDPARRDENERFFSFEKSSPNIIELLPKLKKITKRLVIKSSPLFDTTEARRVFGENITLTTISVGGECKELIIDIDYTNPQSREEVCAINKQGKVARYSFSTANTVPTNSKLLPLENYRFALIADSAVVKCRRVEELATSELDKEALLCTSNSMAISDKATNTQALRCYKIEVAMHFNPKQLKSYFKKNGIKAITIITREFPISVDKIRKTLGVKDGNDATVIFATLDNERVALIVCP